MSAFEGFSKTGLDFLTDLGRRDKPWFDANRATYDAHIVPPAKAFVAAMGEALRDEIGDAIEAQPKTNGSIAPINNDLRFSPDASPYKDHLMFRFWEGPTKKTSAMLMVRLHPKDGVGFASGLNIGDIDRWRQAIAADATGEPFAAALKKLVDATGAEIVGQGLKKVPKPYDPDHPRGDLLRHKGFQVRWGEKVPKTVGSADFVGWCVEQLALTADVHHWLIANVV